MIRKYISFVVVDSLLVMEDHKRIFIGIYKVLVQGKNLLLR